MVPAVLADRVVTFNAADDWPVSFDIETPGFGPMPTGYYIISKDDVEVEFQMDDELENEHDAYHFQGKMNIWSTQAGIKSVSFSCSQTCVDASLTLLYQGNYQYIQNTTALDGVTMTVFEFLDTFRNYVGLEGMGDFLTITVTLDDEESTNVQEIHSTIEVVKVRYFNLAGQEIAQPCGLTIRLTTYTDGSTSVEKLLK